MAGASFRRRPPRPCQCWHEATGKPQRRLPIRNDSQIPGQRRAPSRRARLTGFGQTAWVCLKPRSPPHCRRFDDTLAWQPLHTRNFQAGTR
ncbi:hypothetical protein PJI17_26175 [Mycobacterium kansasii]